MSSHTRVNPIVLVFVGLVCLTSAGAAGAAVQCPASSGGHPLQMADGGTLYLGRPEDNGLQAPDETKRGPNGSVNTWRFFKGGAGFTLVCRYEGTQVPVVLPLTPDIRVCRQEARLRSFVCQ